MAQPRRVDMSIRCFDKKLKLQGGRLTLPRSYIYATRITPADTFGPFARRTKNEAGWRYFEIDSSHSPNVTAPEALMALLEKIVAYESFRGDAKHRTKMRNCAFESLEIPGAQLRTRLGCGHPE